MEMAASGKLYINTKLDTGSVPFELADLRSVHGEVTKFLVTAPGQLSIPLPPLPEGCRVYLTDGGLAANITLPTASKDTAMSALLA